MGRSTTASGIEAREAERMVRFELQILQEGGGNSVRGSCDFGSRQSKFKYSVGRKVGRFCSSGVFPCSLSKIRLDLCLNLRKRISSKLDRVLLFCGLKSAMERAQ